MKFVPLCLKFIPDVEILFIILALKSVFSGSILVWKDYQMEGVLSRGNCSLFQRGVKPMVELIETFPSTRVTPLKHESQDQEEKCVKQSELLDIEIERETYSYDNSII